MIEIISHRGLWKNSDERNSYKSFEESLSNGFGIETDIRDHNGDLIISHDIPLQNYDYLSLDAFLELYKSKNSHNTLALNIKSDGLSYLLKKKLNQLNISNYFVFDMSVPDTLSYSKESVNFYSRQSEYEVDPILYKQCSGIWLDEFHSEWISEKLIKFHNSNNKKVCIVSPELHGRAYLKEWEKYKNIYIKNPDLSIIICTDFPLEARSYFE